MTECNHDWRIDPSISLTTNPPQKRLVCLDCGASRSSGIPSSVPRVWLSPSERHHVEDWDVYIDDPVLNLEPAPKWMTSKPKPGTVFHWVEE